MRTALKTLVLAAAMVAAAPNREVCAMENPIQAQPIRTERLSNGLTVFLLEDHSVPLVAIDVNYQVGSKNERPGRTGFAHLFEHLMFQGSKHYDDDYFKPLQDIGGQVNGATSTDRTRYWEVVPAGYLERALWLEADRMGFLLEATTQERLDNQRSVVKNERRQNYDNRPYGTVWERLLTVLYPPNHPYSWPTIGSMEDLEAATLDDVKDFFRTYYAPNNASIALVGDFDPDAAMALIERHFGAIPPGPPVSRVAEWVPVLSADVLLEVQDRVQLPRTYRAWHTVPLYHGDDAALDAFAQIVGGGKTSRLYLELVHQKQIAQDASTYHMSSQLAGVLMMVLTPRPGNALEDVERAAERILRLAAEKGVTREELDRVKTTVLADYVRGMQNIGGFGGIADRINAYHHHLGEPDRFRWDLQRYLDLTPDQVNRAARAYLARASATARVRPLPTLAASTSPEATGLDRAVMPGKGPESAFRLPTRHAFRLDNGLRVIRVEDRRLPLASAVLIVPGGSASDPANLPGLASLTTSLMEEGAAGKSSQELAEALEKLGATLDVRTSTDAAVVSLSTLTSTLDQAFGLMADVVTRPDFPPDELERQRVRRRVQLKQVQDQPGTVALVVAQRAVFGDHPYAAPGFGTPDAVEAITREDIVGWWRRTFVPGHATLLVVGDVGEDALRRSLDRTLGAWAAGPIPDLALPRPVEGTGRTVYLVDRPGAVQSNLVVAELGTDRLTPDYAALDVLNTALGGAFVSRLNLNLREDKGYTYGARTRFEFGKVPGAFAASAPVQTEVTGPAIVEMIKEIQEIGSTRPLAGDELRYAVDSIVNGYARRFATANQVAGELVDVYLYGLPDDAPERYPAQVAAITSDDVARAARTHVRPEALSIVVVGDREKVLPVLRELDLGPIVETDWLGRPIGAAARPEAR